MVRRHLKKFKFGSGRQHPNISCGPDSPLFALPQLSHLANYEWIFHFVMVEIYYFTRKQKNCQKTGSTAPRKIQLYRSGRQHQNIFCGPDSPLFSLPQISHLVNFDWIFHFSWWKYIILQESRKVRSKVEN